jgi:clathrin heavy chain
VESVANQKGLNRAIAFCERSNESSVWSLLGKLQLRLGLFNESCESFIKAQDASEVRELIKIAEEMKAIENDPTTAQYLIDYLLMARKCANKDSFIDSELLYIFARTDRLNDLDEFLIANPTHHAPLEVLGDRCFADKMYKAAKVFYASENNYSKLALTLCRLDDMKGAIDCARKANNIKIWKELCFKSIQRKEFPLAQSCALNIIIHAEELDDIIHAYSRPFYHEQLMQLLEVSLGLERAHMGIFTQLAILYASHKPAALREHLELFWSRMNIPKVLRAADENHLWPELVFLYDKYEEYDNAIVTMMLHPTETWRDSQFKDIITKVSNHELYFKAIKFYLDYKPMLLNDFLIILAPKLDNNR